MTIKELYEAAKAQNIEDYEIEIEWRDAGGAYDGSDKLRIEDIKANDATRVVLFCGDSLY